MFCLINDMENIEGYVCVASWKEGEERKEDIFGKDGEGKRVKIEDEGFRSYSGLDEVCRDLQKIKEELKVESARVGYLRIIEGKREIDFLDKRK